MSRPLAILVRGHAPSTYGAAYGDWIEYDAIPEYLIPAEVHLRAKGCSVIRLEMGSLRDRQPRGLAAIESHRKAPPGAPCVYVSAHLNAGGAAMQRSITFHDKRSRGGERAATGIAKALGDAYGWPSTVWGTHADGWLSRPHNSISRIYSGSPSNCCAVLTELASVDREPLTIDLLHRGGTALGVGLAEYLHSEAS